MAPVKIPDFFAVYIPQFNVDRMKIPTQFEQHMRGKTSGSVHLTGPSGNTWTLELMKNKDGLFFDKGWTTFVKDHMIQVGEFLVFKYNGNSGFDVVICGHDACEKKSAYYAKCSQQVDDEDSPKRTAGSSKFEEDPDIHDSAPEENERVEVVILD